jgi:hypothetical protein
MRELKPLSNFFMPKKYAYLSRFFTHENSIVQTCASLLEKYPQDEPSHIEHDCLPALYVSNELIVKGDEI